jgi:hypothetical protein
MQYLVAAGLILFGFYVTIHSFGMVKLVGRTDWAERYLGVGGSYTMWKLLGILSIIVALYVIKNPGLFGL